MLGSEDDDRYVAVYRLAKTSYSASYQKTGRDLMSRQALAIHDGSHNVKSRQLIPLACKNTLCTRISQPYMGLYFYYGCAALVKQHPPLITKISLQGN